MQSNAHSRKNAFPLSEQLRARQTARSKVTAMAWCTPRTIAPGRVLLLAVQHPTTCGYPKPNPDWMAIVELAVAGDQLGGGRGYWVQVGPGCGSPERGGDHRSSGKEQKGEQRLHPDDAIVRDEKKSTRAVSTTLLVGTIYQ